MTHRRSPAPSGNVRPFPFRRLVSLAGITAFLSLIVLLVGALFLKAGETSVRTVRLEHRRFSIAHDWTVRRSRFMAPGWSVILRDGRDGKKQAVLLIERDRDGKRSVRVLSERRLRIPEKGTLLAGAGTAANPIQAPRRTRVLRTLRLKATAYTPGADTNTPQFSGITALGWPTGAGIVAVDPKVIPLRTLLYVEGYGLAWAGDTGGKIKGARIDLCLPTRQQALDFGVRTLTVHVLARPWSDEPVLASRDLYRAPSPDMPRKPKAPQKER